MLKQLLMNYHHQTESQIFILHTSLDIICHPENNSLIKVKYFPRIYHALALKDSLTIILILLTSIKMSDGNVDSIGTILL
jgi:hypothetical protein